MKKITFILAVVIILSNCKNQKSEETTAETQIDTLIEFTDQQIQTAGIEIGQLEQKELSVNITATGVVEATPGNKVSLSIPIGAYVKKIFVRHGDYVKYGQALIEVENLDFIDMQSEYLQKKTKLEYLQTEYQRKETLYNQGAIPLKQYQQAKSEYFSLYSEVKGLEEKLRLLGINPNKITPENIKSSVILRAKISGYVGEIYVNVGEYVSPEKVLLDISNPNAYSIMLDVYGKYRPFVKIGQKIVFSIPGVQKQMEATIYSITPTLDPQTKTFKVHAAPVENYENLIEGAYVSAKIVSTTQKAYTLPKTAIVEIRGVNYVYVEVSKNKFKAVPVKIGIEDKNLVEIENYQNLLGKKIVIKGANYIKAKQYLSQE